MAAGCVLVAPPPPASAGALRDALEARGLRLGAATAAYNDPALRFSFAAPAGWVAAPNRTRDGVIVSDYASGARVAVERVAAPPQAQRDDPDVLAALVADVALVPSSQSGGDARLGDSVDVRRGTEDVTGRPLLRFTTEATTRSGYQSRRRNVATYVVRGGEVFVLTASADAVKWDARTEEQLLAAVRSFVVN